MARKKDKSQDNLQKYITRIEAAENFRDRNYRDRWTRFYKMWRNVVDQLTDDKGKPIKDRSNISIPYAFTMIETILPRLVETLFAGRPYVSIKGIPLDFQHYHEYKDLKPWEDSACKMETLLDYQQNIVFDIQDIFHTGLKVAALYGTTVAYTGWKLQERDVTRKELQPVMDDTPDPVTGLKMPMMEMDGVTQVMDYNPVTVTVKEYDDPEAEFLDLGLFFVDQNAKDIDDARFAGHVEYLSKRELDAMAESDPDMNIDWKKVPSTSVKNNARNFRMSAIGIPVGEDSNLTLDQDFDLYEVHHYWEDDKCVVILNRGYVAKESENPFWHKKKPYDKDVYTRVPHEFYGIGVIEMIEDLQLELNTERNQRIDYRSYSMRRMFKVLKTAEIDPKDLVWKQGGKIRVDDKDDVTVIDMPPMSGDSFNQESVIKADMRDATGSQDVVMGGSSGGTATEAMRNDNNAAMRFKLIISSLEKRLLVNISRKMIQLNQQFIEDVRVLPKFDQPDQEWPEITPEEIQGEFHLTAAGSSVEPLANKEAFKQRMVELYGVASRDPFFQQFPIKRRNLLKKVFESFNITDVDDILPTDEELSGVMEQQAVMQFISSLPPELQQILQRVLQPPAAPMMPPNSSSPPPGVGMGGGGANTAMMQEHGLHVVGGGG